MPRGGFKSGRGTYKPTFKSKSKFAPRSSAARVSRQRIARVAKAAVLKQKETKVMPVNTDTTTTLAATWTDINTARSLSPFNGCGTGDGASNRDGMEVMSRGIAMRLQLTSASDRPMACRILVLEKIADYTSSDLPDAVNGFYPTNKLNSLYRVKFDKVYNIRPYLDDASSMFRAVYPRIWIPLRKKIKYSGSSSTDLDTGELRMWALCDNLAGGTDFIDITSIRSNFYFKDI